MPARPSFSGRHARDGGSEVKASVPATTHVADTSSAACGETTAVRIGRSAAGRG